MTQSPVSEPCESTTLMVPLKTVACPFEAERGYQNRLSPQCRKTRTTARVQKKPWQCGKPSVMGGLTDGRLSTPGAVLRLAWMIF